MTKAIIRNKFLSDLGKFIWVYFWRPRWLRGGHRIEQNSMMYHGKADMRSKHDVALLQMSKTIIRNHFDTILVIFWRPRWLRRVPYSGLCCPKGYPWARVSSQFFLGLLQIWTIKFLDTHIRWCIFVYCIPRKRWKKSDRFHFERTPIFPVFLVIFIKSKGWALSIIFPIMDIW